MNAKHTILYICPDVSLGGSTRSLINLIMAVSDWVEPIVLFPSKGVGYDKMKELGVECIVFPYVLIHELRSSSWRQVLLHPWRLLFVKHIRVDWKCARFVKQELKGKRVDIVHSNFSPVTIGCILSKMLHARHVWHIREFVDLHFNFNIYFGVPRLRWLVNRADARVVISNQLYEHWQFGQKNTWIIHNPICRKSEACYMKRKESYLLFCSYFLTEAKGARFAIEAFGMSGMYENGYRLKLMGNCDETYKVLLMATALEYGVADKIDFVSCQTNVKPWFAQATAFIMASQCEGLGRVTAEAMFYGCPVIARATGGTLDLVKDGVTGYLYGTIEECAQLIQKVCKENQEKIIQKAQEFAVNSLSIEVYGPKIMEVYNSVMKQ